MLFGDIDWNQVLMQGLIGGIIGGVIGLGVFLVKKMNGGGQIWSWRTAHRGQGQLTPGEVTRTAPTSHAPIRVLLALPRG